MSLKGRCVITNIESLIITVNHGSDFYNITLLETDQSKAFCDSINKILSIIKEPFYIEVKPDHTEVAYTFQGLIIKSFVKEIEELDATKYLNARYYDAS